MHASHRCRSGESVGVSEQINQGDGAGGEKWARIATSRETASIAIAQSRRIVSIAGSSQFVVERGGAGDADRVGAGDGGAVVTGAGGRQCGVREHSVRAVSAVSTSMYERYACPVIARWSFACCCRWFRTCTDGERFV